jgi:hypothetical protein
MELLGRRVRSAGDLDLAGQAPLICVIPAVEQAKRSKFDIFSKPWRWRGLGQGRAVRA